MYSSEEVLEAAIKYFGDDDVPAKIWMKKYALRDENDNLLEKTPDDTHRRIAREIARIEKKKFQNPLSEEEIFSHFKNFERHIPQGSPMFAIGNYHQYTSSANCFVIGCGDSYGHITQSDQELVQLSKRRGGVGLTLDALRPAGTTTKNCAKTSTGIIPFMERYSNSTREVAQNARRGALMETLNIHHPESVILSEEKEREIIVNPKMEHVGVKPIYTTTKYYDPENLDFCSIKYDRARVTGANISLKLTDKFMNAVKHETEFIQQWPINSDTPKVIKFTDAQQAWDKIITAAWNTAEPGIIFWDNILKESLGYCYKDFGFEEESTNPCLTDDTWILTDRGPRQIKELIGLPFGAVVNGKIYSSTADGFWLTGKKKVYLIKTDRGFNIQATSNHKFLVNNIWTKLNDLKIGDELSLSNQTNIEWAGNGTIDIGWLLGSFIGDGNISEKRIELKYWGDTQYYMKGYVSTCIQANLKCRSDCGSGKSENKEYSSISTTELYNLAQEYGFILGTNKSITNESEKLSSDFWRGFLSGWFDADGTVHCDSEKGHYVRLCSVNLDWLEIAQRVLSRLGIISTIYTDRQEEGYKSLPDGNGGYKDYYCKSTNELHISKNNLLIFKEKIGFVDPNKKLELNKILNSYTKGPYKEKFITVITDIIELEEENVYDCTIPEINEFCANGLRSHNCSEIPLAPYDSCRLYCLNLFGYVINPFTQDASFDYEAFYNDAKLAIRFMDSIVDLEIELIDRIINKILDDPEDEEVKRIELNLWKKIKNKAEQGRRTGIGITSLGDTLAALGIKYASDESLEVVDKIYKTLKFGCYRGSVDLAKELGPFPIWDHDKEKNNPFLLRIKNETLTLTDNLILSGEKLFNDMKKYGRRNIMILTTAPTGTISILAKILHYFNVTSGIEPAIFLEYIRKIKITPDSDLSVDSVDQNGDRWHHFKISHAGLRLWREITGKNKIEDSPYYKATANEINWQNRVKLQGIAQKHIDHSISSTINLPADVSVDEVKKIYEKAWEVGLKGITVYREGCRSGVLTQEDNTEFAKREKELPCQVYHVTAKGQPYFVLLGMMNNKPYEIFAGKNGFLDKKIAAGTIKKIKRGKYQLIYDNEVVIDSITDYDNDDEEALTRMTSANLRHGTPIQFVVQQLEKVDGDMHCLAKSMARALKKFVPENIKVTGDSCGSCNSENLVRSEGCIKCIDCGWSKC